MNGYTIYYASHIAIVLENPMYEANAHEIYSVYFPDNPWNH
jgi:hypothetical protein